MKRDAILNGATVLGGLAGSYAAHLKSKTGTPLGFWEGQVWGALGGVAGRVIGMAIVNAKGKEVKWR
jgi:hypothetical protein